MLNTQFLNEIGQYPPPQPPQNELSVTLVLKSNTDRLLASWSRDKITASRASNMASQDC